MDISASQLNSASESGWTHYLDQSSLSGNCFQMSGGIAEYGGIVDEEEEDLSMVSDASSGPPPHYLDDDDECCYEDWYHSHSSSQYTKESKEKNQQKKKVKESYRHHQQVSHLDDDTASSPVFSCSKKEVNFSGNGEVENALDFSQGFSATRIKGKSKFQKQFGFFECSIAGKQGAKEEGGFGEAKRK